MQVLNFIQTVFSAHDQVLLANAIRLGGWQKHCDLSEVTQALDRHSPDRHSLELFACTLVLLFELSTTQPNLIVSILIALPAGVRQGLDQQPPELCFVQPHRHLGEEAREVAQEHALQWPFAAQWGKDVQVYWYPVLQLHITLTIVQFMTRTMLAIQHRLLTRPCY